MAQTQDTQTPTIDETLIPYAIGVLAFCLAASLLIALSRILPPWLPGQFPLTLALCLALPLAAAFSHRYQAGLSHMAAREYATQALLARVGASVLLLVGLPLLEWSRLHPGHSWQNSAFVLPVAVSLAATQAAWTFAAALYRHWHLLHVQIWESGAGTAQINPYDAGGVGRVDRTREVAALWRLFASGGIVLGFALFAAIAFVSRAGVWFDLVLVLLFACYILTGLLFLGRAALLRLATESSLDRLPLAGAIPAVWTPTAIRLVLGTTAAVVLVLLLQGLALAHAIVFWLWSTALAPALLAIAFWLSHLFTGTNQQQFNSSIRKIFPTQPHQRPVPPPPHAHANPLWAALYHALPWVVAALLALLLLRAYLRYRQERVHGTSWRQIARAMLAELRRLLLVLFMPARRLAEQVMQRAVTAAAGVGPAGRRGRDRYARDLSPRALIVYLYTQAIALAARRGHPRQPGQTPGEYAADIGTHLGENRAAFDALTVRFVEARYSRHPVDTGDAEQARACWTQLRSALRRRRF